MAFDTAVYDSFIRFIKSKNKDEDAVLRDLIEKQIGADRSHGVAVCDILALIDTEFTNDKRFRSRFYSLVKLVAKYVGAGLLKQSLESDTLRQCELISSVDELQKRYVRLKTKLFYKQQKFNLLREENEGYAKLIAELNQDFTYCSDIDHLSESIRSLIGSFDLDPNRVLDIILEAFEYRFKQTRVFSQLIHSFNYDRQTVCQILGFKFQSYGKIATPESLCQIAAILLRDGLIELGHLWPHLSPSDNDILELNQKEQDKAKKYARLINTVCLVEKSEAEKEKEKEELKPSEFLFINNQKFGLLRTCLLVGAWETAAEILNYVPHYCPSSHISIAQPFCLLISHMIQPLYERHHGVPDCVITVKPTPLPSASIPPALDFNQLLSNVVPMLKHMGPNVCFDHGLFGRLIRLFRCMVIKSRSRDGPPTSSHTVCCASFPSESSVLSAVLTITDEVFLPALTCSFANCCMSEELWGLLSLLPYEDRYSLYGRWKSKSYAEHGQLVRIRAEVLDKAKYLMKRLTRDNVKQTGRLIGKLSHCCPPIVFEYVLTQLQRYDNLIVPVVDSLKYLTSMSYDVLVYCLLEALVGQNREKVEKTTFAPWLQSLAVFTGLICRKYFQQLDIVGLLQYVANELKCGKCHGSSDLLILREILHTMAGIEVTETLTNDQLDCMTGGELLRQEGGYFLQVRNTKKSSHRLKENLMENALGIPLCILMAQQRNCILYSEESKEMHVKLVGILLDNCQNTLVQMGSFLLITLSTEEFQKSLPSVEQLLKDYDLPPAAAFFLCRHMYTQAILTQLENSKENSTHEKLSSVEKENRYVSAMTDVIGSVVKGVEPVISEASISDLSLHFYVTFWSLSANDLEVPRDAYRRQFESLEQQIRDIEENDSLTSTKKKKEREKCVQMKERLKEEEKLQEERVHRVVKFLKEHKDSWFEKGSRSEAILQHCVLPRVTFSAVDAVFCNRLIKLLHWLETRNFVTLLFFDRIFMNVTCIIATFTDDEAHRFGRFLCLALELTLKWHSKKDIYDEECMKSPGFTTVIKRPDASEDDIQAPEKAINFEMYRNVVYKWHFRITKSFNTSLKSTNYILIRNTIIILTKILPNFPRLRTIGRVIESRVDELCKTEKDERPDIYALAVSYLGLLRQKRETWVEETDFHIPRAKPVVARVNAATTGRDSPSTGKSHGRHLPKDSVHSSASGASSPDSSQELHSRKEPGEHHHSASDQPRSKREASATSATEVVSASKRVKQEPVTQNGTEIVEIEARVDRHAASSTKKASRQAVVNALSPASDHGLASISLQSSTSSQNARIVTHEKPMHRSVSRERLHTNKSVSHSPDSLEHGKSKRGPSRDHEKARAHATQEGQITVQKKSKREVIDSSLDAENYRQTPPPHKKRRSRQSTEN